MSLATKLVEVMKAIDRVPKRGHNDFHNYDYATESDVLETVRHELADRGVLLLPTIKLETREPLGGKSGVLTTLDMVYTFWDSESGEQIDRSWKGWGQDGGDKGGYKALTGSEKYFLLKSFLIPTGDDPERDGQTAGAPTPSAAATPPPPTTSTQAPNGQPIPVIVHPKTKELLPLPPPGWHYCLLYRWTEPWHHASILDWDGQGGALKLRTKNAVGLKMKEADEKTAWVRVLTQPTHPKVGDDTFLNDLFFYDDVPF